MALAWLMQRFTHNAGWVDAFWSFGTGAGGVAAALAPIGEPLIARNWIVAGLALAWSVRLGGYITARNLRGGHEDVRYARFRAEWGANFESRLFGFLMAQALVAALLVFCIMLAARNPIPHLGPADLAGVAVFFGAWAGETISDQQMHRFRGTPGNRGKVCELGLWGWSRHPNYFFEFLGWVAYPLLAASAGWPFLCAATAAPIAMYWFLVDVSGIPPLEREMLDSRGDAYRDYQARVSPFFPLPPRAKAS
jgi:steroid 5-alpha reductase family enzyme